MEEDFLQFSLCLFIMILLVEGEETLGDGLSNSVDLVCGTTTTDSDFHVKVLESVSTDEEDGLNDLELEGLGFDQTECSSINSDGSGTLGNDGDSGSILLLTESLNLAFLLSAHSQ